MSSPAGSQPSAAELAREENASPEEVVESALALYAALPPVVRTAALDALRSPDTRARTTLINELVRTVAACELRQRRDTVRQRAAAGEVPALPDLTDEEMGAEAVRLVKESRQRRATSRG